MTSRGSSSATPGEGAAARAGTKARRATRKTPRAAEDYRRSLVFDFFAQPVHDYAHRCIGRPVSLLQAGCLTSLDELGLYKLREDGFDIEVMTVDAGYSRPGDLAGGDSAGEVIVGDLRTIPLPPRSFDIVHCSMLLDRISHVPLVLDRFSAALRPGGLLLLRVRDRDCAAGFLDRQLPGLARRAVWKRLYPGQPGPFPAVYESTVSSRGIAAYMLMRGLVISQRRTARTLPHQPERLCRTLSFSRGLIAWLSRGQLTDAHDELLFVIRKPEDRFARVVLTAMRSGGLTCQ
jgi:SAM-dependent methyltransferase